MTGMSGEHAGEHVGELSSTFANEVCPILGGPVDPEAGVSHWNGKEIGFCCAPCQPKWEKLSEAQKADKLATAMQSSTANGDSASHAHDDEHGSHDHT
ncbi:MAG: hypothetical protein KDA55_05075 [Planctomycetales bacterium]|nr:hypothetical protein [Planctomycetales bacterium]MCA9207704.1 hypothetical protein [Planctomycetales bacterium]